MGGVARTTRREQTKMIAPALLPTAGERDQDSEIMADPLPTVNRTEEKQTHVEIEEVISFVNLCVTVY